MMSEKLPPHNIEAEEAALGSLLIDNEAVYSVSTFLRPEDFFREKNQWIYEACLSLYQRNEAINQITVAHELVRQNRFDEIDGAAYLSHLVSIVPTSLHIEHFARIVSNLAVMRRLIAAAGQIAAIGYESDPDVELALSKAENALFQVSQKQGIRDLVSLRQVLDQYFESAKPPAEQETELAHILTGFVDLDGFLGGLQRSDLVIVAARPSLGKTSLALGIARNAALEQQATVALFSLEMSREALVQRLLSAEANIDSRRIRSSTFTESEERRIMDASGRLSEAPIYVDDSPQVRPMEMRSKVRRLHFEKGVDLVIVDYLQLMQSETRTENRVQEISHITRSLKAMARDLNAPVLAVSQLSRQVEWRASHRPQLSDLRESGSIEQDADVVMFIYRDDFYFKTEEEWYKEHDVNIEYPRGIAEIIVAKHRNGPTDTVKLRFKAGTAKFDNAPVQTLAE